jgi:hypothetical protein
LYGLLKQIVSDRDGCFIMAQRVLAEAFSVVRHRASYEYQLPPIDRWIDIDRQQMGGGVSEELCGRVAMHMGEMVAHG